MPRTTTSHRAQLIKAGAGLLFLIGCADELPTRPEAESLATAAGALASAAPAQPGSPPQLVWSPGDPGEGFDFDGVVMGGSRTQQFTLTNVGGSASSALTIGWAGGASFRIADNGCGRASLPPRRSCNVTVEFAPQFVGEEDVVIFAQGHKREAVAQLQVRGRGDMDRLQGSQPVSPVFGNGTEARPYTKACDWYEWPDHCIVYFPWRTLSWLQSETVPAYLCPNADLLRLEYGLDRMDGSTNFPWLRNESHVPPGTSTVQGVQVEGLGPIGIYIPFAIPHTWFHQVYPADFASGTRRLLASATNWSTVTRSYRVVLHCTRNFELVYLAAS